MRNLTLKQLDALVAAARTGSITLAAAELGLTPSAMTTRIKELEASVDTVLFERSPRGLQLNEAGKTVLLMATHIRSAVDLAEATLADMRGLKTGRISIGIVSTAKYFAPRLVAAFSKLHPGIDVSITVGNRQTILQALQQMSVDLAIMGRPPKEGHVSAIPFGDHPHVIIAPSDHRLAGKRSIAKADITDEPFLLREDGSGTRRVFDEFFEGRANRSPHVNIEIGSNETIKQGVIAGLGLALISGHTIASEVESGRLVVLNVVGLPIWRSWFVTRRLDKTEMPAMRAFREFVNQNGAAYLPVLAFSKNPAGATAEQ